MKGVLGISVLPSYFVVQGTSTATKTSTANTHHAQAIDSRGSMMRRQDQGLQASSQSLLQDGNQWSAGYSPYAYPGPMVPQMGYPYGYTQNVMPMYTMPPIMPSAPSMYTYPPPPWASPGTDHAQAIFPAKQEVTPEVPPPTHDWSLDPPLDAESEQPAMTEDELYMKLDEVAASKGDQGALDRISQALKGQASDVGDSFKETEVPRRQANEALRRNAILDEAMSKIWGGTDQSSAHPDNSDATSSLAKSAVELGGFEPAHKKIRHHKQRGNEYQKSERLHPTEDAQDNSIEDIDNVTESMGDASTLQDSANQTEEEDRQWAKWSLGARDRYWGNWDSVKAIDDSFSSSSDPQRKDWWQIASDSISLHKLIGKDQNWGDWDASVNNSASSKSSSDNVEPGSNASSVSNHSSASAQSSDSSVSQTGTHSDDLLDDDGDHETSVAVQTDTDVLQEGNHSDGLQDADGDADSSKDSNTQRSKSSDASDDVDVTEGRASTSSTAYDSSVTSSPVTANDAASSQPGTQSNTGSINNVSHAKQDLVKPSPEDKQAASGDSDAMQKLADEIAGEKALESKDSKTTTPRPGIDDDDVNAAANGDDDAMRKLAAHMR